MLGLCLIVPLPASAQLGCDMPVELNDGWSRATPSQVGIHTSRLCSIDKFLEQWPEHNIHAVLMVRRRKLVMDRYFTGTDERWGTPLVKAQYVLGLSATVTRKDGHHPIIFMQCGPVRHRVDAKKQAALRPFDHRVIFRRTAFRHVRNDLNEKPAIQELYASLAQDAGRNDFIFDDILSALEAGRSPLVITERKDHLDLLAGRLSKFAKNVIVLRGGMSVRQSRAAIESLAAIPASEERVLVATGRYLGEGFDDARLDTLFLTMPISWRGILAQYTGRLHRLYATKREVVIYDYVDGNEPVLARMAVKREAGYRSLGYAL